MGTFTHESDLMLVVQPLRRLLRRNAGSIEFQIVGGISEPGWLALFDGLPVKKLEVPPESVEYRVRGWMANLLGIGIAPLEDHRSTSGSRSVLDYSARFPGVQRRSGHSDDSPG
jgi:hypothetical protein